MTYSLVHINNVQTNSLVHISNVQTEDCLLNTMSRLFGHVRFYNSDKLIPIPFYAVKEQFKDCTSKNVWIWFTYHECSSCFLTR